LADGFARGAAGSVPLPPRAQVAGGRPEIPGLRSRWREIPRCVSRSREKRQRRQPVLSQRKPALPVRNEDQDGQNSIFMNTGNSPDRNAVTSPSPERVIDIGGLVPLSTTDFPGGLPAAVVFLQG